jgi:protein TonB
MIVIAPAIMALALAATPPVPLSQARWWARTDTPRQPKHEQGTVAISVTVRTDGRAKDCVVTQSSGVAELDKLACDNFLKYVRFKPATDDKGNPAEGTYSTKITYALR